jgi:hypothetical protein
MTFPIESLAGDHRTIGLALAVVIGVAFGFVLERAGLGRVEKLMGQFSGHDMTVLRVLFTAIVTAMAGAVLLSALGLLDLPFVQARNPTFLWPMIVGGVVLGEGFVVSGYCPGTCVVAAGTGKLDAIATLVGVGLGGLAYAEVEGAMGTFPRSGDLGALSVARWLGLPAPAVVVAIAAVAAGAFAVAARVERLAARRGAPPRVVGDPADPAERASANADVAVTS